MTDDYLTEDNYSEKNFFQRQFDVIGAYSLNFKSMPVNFSGRPSVDSLSPVSIVEISGIVSSQRFSSTTFLNFR